MSEPQHRPTPEAGAHARPEHGDTEAPGSAGVSGREVKEVVCGEPHQETTSPPARRRPPYGPCDRTTLRKALGAALRWVGTLESVRLPRLSLVALSVATVVLLLGRPASGQDMLTSIVDQFQASGTLMLGAMQVHGRYLFGLLATLELIVVGIMMVFRSPDLSASFARLTLKVLWLGMLYVAMESAFAWLGLLVDSFIDVGQNAVTMADPISSPSDIIALGTELAMNILAEATLDRGWWSMTGYSFFELLAGSIGAIGVYFCCMFAAVSLGVVLIELAIVLPLSPLLVSFAALKETSGLAASGIVYVVSLGIRVMLIFLIIIIAASALKAALTTYVASGLTRFFGLDLLVPAFLFWKAVREIPPRAADAVVQHLSIPLAELHELGRSG